MKVALGLLAVVACLAAVQAANVPFTPCGSNNRITVQSIDVNPFPVKPGAGVSFQVVGSADAQVTGGSYTFTVQYLGITLLTKSGDICELDPNYKCPFAAGIITIGETLDVPSIAPQGSYNIQAKATDQNGQPLLCVNVGFNIGGVVEELIEDAPAQTEEMISHINSVQSSWVAGFNSKFESQTLGHVKGLCGSLTGGPVLPVRRIDTPMAVPTEFDSRDAWPQCPSNKVVRDQGACGSCWAFGAVEAMTDRICIATNGTSQPYLAAQDVLSCCGFWCGSGCQGGYPSAAWSYFQSTGIVTGGDYNSNQGCSPYPVAACEHHVPGPLPECGDIVPTPSCTQKCINGLNWSQDKHFGATSYSVPSDVETIQKEIMTRGPVEGAFSVYADFPTYKSGVYKHTTGAYLGGHAIKVLGWGVENNTPYWLCANSWNTAWGDQGFFKILRGSNHCGIEGGIVAGVIKG